MAGAPASCASSNRWPEAKPCSLLIVSSRCTPYQRLNSSSWSGLTLLSTTIRWVVTRSAPDPAAVAGDLALVVAGQDRGHPHLEDDPIGAVEQLAPGHRVGRLQAGGELVEEPLL